MFIIAFPPFRIKPSIADMYSCSMNGPTLATDLAWRGPKRLPQDFGTWARYVAHLFVIPEYRRLRLDRGFEAVTAT